MKKIIVVLLGVLLAFLAGALLLALQDYNPLASYISMFENSLLSNTALRNTLVRMAILTMLGLSAFFGFNSGVTNLGQFGQLLMGALVATLIGIYVRLPGIVLIPLMLVSGALAGGLFSAIAGAFKLYFKMNEFITTLMMNFLAQYFIAYLVANPMKDPQASWPMSPRIADAGVFPMLGLVDLSVILMLAIFVGIYVYWNYSKQGYEFRLTGENNIFSLIGGCRISKNLMSAMFISGVLAGIAGAFLIMGSTQQNKLLPNLGNANAGDGLMIAIIAGNSMPSVLFFGGFFGLLQTGAVGMQLDTNVPSEFTVMLQATMVLFVVAFRDYSDTVINRVKAFMEERKLRERTTQARKLGVDTK